MPLMFRLQNNIGFIEFDQDDSKVNLLTSDVIKELDKALDNVKNNTLVHALVFISKKKDVFIAGADIKEIEKIVEPKDGMAKAKAGQDVLNKIEDLKIPTIAVVDGVALGGGCELTLACLYRVSTFNDKVRIGLPEVNLGFVPGFGGTYRLPRIVGLSEGLKMILAGKPIDSNKALRIGLFDQLFPQNGLATHVHKFVSEILAGNIKKKRYSPKKKKGLEKFLDESRLGNRLVFYKSRQSVISATKGFYPAPLKAIDVVQKNFYTNREEGLEIEARGFGELAITAISKNLVHVFYLSEEYKKLKVEGADNVAPSAIDKCGVLGAGIMGGGIAQLLSSKGIWCRLKDISYDAIGKGYQAAAKIYKQAVDKRILSKAVAQEKMAHISGTLDYSGFGNLDMVIEAVVENMDVKRKVFKELSDVVGQKTILATNTSALSVTEMAKATKDPSKVIGFHFFNPVHRMPLVEIITTPMTSTETLVASLNLVKRLGKTAIVVKDSCGFVVNRILLGYINEAGRILEEGADMQTVDKVATDFGMPMGPFTLSDEVGLDVGIKVLHILEQAFGDRFKPTVIFDSIYKKGFLGKKSGKGFYIHQKKRVPNPEVQGLLGKTAGRSFNREECEERLILIMVNEAARCLEDGIVNHASAIDVGMIFGIGFPAFRGGLLKYADDLGVENIVAKLEKLESTLKAERFKPCRYLVDLKNQKNKFYQR